MSSINKIWNSVKVGCDRVTWPTFRI